jgi:hypothetical protein
MENSAAGDPDGDFSSNGDEQAARTGPRDGGSAFRIIGTERLANNDTGPVFTTEDGLTYAIDHGVNNRDGSITWTPFYNQADTVGTYHDTDSATGAVLYDNATFETGGIRSGSGMRLYRVRIKPEPMSHLDLVDGGGYLWEINGDGAWDESNGSLFGGNGFFNPDFVGLTSAHRTGVPTQMLTDLVAPFSTGLQFVRRVYAAPTGSFIRYLEVVHNASEVSTVHDVFVRSHYGLSGGTNITTSSGDAVLDNNDLWTLSDDADGTGFNAVYHLFGGLGAQGPDLAETRIQFPSHQDEIAWFLNLDPGETQIIMHFAIQGVTRTAALAGALSLSALPPEALAEISDEDLARIINFNVPPR